MLAFALTLGCGQVWTKVQDIISLGRHCWSYDADGNMAASLPLLNALP